MTFNDFDSWIVDHWAKNSTRINSTPLYLSNALCGEVGELANVIKKIVRETDKQGGDPVFNPNLTDDFRIQIANEAGDVLHYLLRLMWRAGLTPELVMEMNRNKLVERYESKGRSST